MVQPAPRMMSAPVRNRAEVLRIVMGGVMGMVNGAARRVLNKHGKKR